MSRVRDAAEKVHVRIQRRSQARRSRRSRSTTSPGAIDLRNAPWAPRPLSHVPCAAATRARAIDLTVTANHAPVDDPSVAYVFGLIRSDRSTAHLVIAVARGAVSRAMPDVLSRCDRSPAAWSRRRKFVRRGSRDHRRPAVVRELLRGSMCRNKVVEMRTPSDILGTEQIRPLKRVEYDRLTAEGFFDVFSTHCYPSLAGMMRTFPTCHSWIA